MDRQDRPFSPSVSVIVPAYRAAGTIERCVRSALRQTVSPAEIIVVVDGEGDKTAKIARSMQGEAGQVRLIVIEQENRGAGAARNVAIAAAGCDLLAFLDADDEWLPEKLARSVARFSAPGMILTAHNGWVVSDGCERYLDIARRFRDAAADPIHALYRRGFISTSSVVARRDAVLAAGGFDETLRTGQDFDLWLKMLGRPNAIYEVFEDSLTRYYVSSSGITGNRLRRLDNTLTIAVRHAPRLRRYTGHWVASFVFRVVAIHAEAVVGLWKAGQRGDSIRTLLYLMPTLLRASVLARSMSEP